MSETEADDACLSYLPVASVVAVEVVYALLRRWSAERIPGEYETLSSYLQDRLP